MRGGDVYKNFQKSKLKLQLGITSFFILIFFGMITLLILFPFKESLEDKEVISLANYAKNKAINIEQFLRTSEYIAERISSRPKARALLENISQIDPSNFNQETYYSYINKLNEDLIIGLEESSNLLQIDRFDSKTNLITSVTKQKKSLLPNQLELKRFNSKLNQFKFDENFKVFIIKKHIKGINGSYIGFDQTYHNLQTLSDILKPNNYFKLAEISIDDYTNSSLDLNKNIVKHQLIPIIDKFLIIQYPKIALRNHVWDELYPIIILVAIISIISVVIIITFQLKHHSLEIQFLQHQSKMNQHIQSSLDDIKEFSKIISHDLSEPIKRIAAISDLIEDENKQSPNPSITILHQDIYTSIQNMFSILSNFRILVNIPSNDIKKDFISIKKMKDLSLSKVITQGKTITLVSPEGEIYCNPRLFCQLLQIILQNAYSHSLKDHVDVTIEYVPKDKYGELHITNSYSMIPENQIQEIFKPLKQLTSSAKKHGVGMGLTIAKQIARAHNWTIDVKSSPDDMRTTILLKEVEFVKNKK